MGKFLSSVLAFLMFVSLAEAEMGISNKSIGTPALTPGKETALAPVQAPSFKGLFDTRRFSFQHTVGVSFRSGTFGGGNQYYLNTITYRASEPLVIQAQIGVQNNLYGRPAYGSSGGGATQIIVPHIGVLYQPRSNIRIELQFSNTPYYGWDDTRRGYRY